MDPGPARRPAADWCSGQYKVYGQVDAPDRSLIITSLAVSSQEQIPLAGGARTALWARLGDDSGGQIDLVVTRAGAGGDTLGVGARPCGTTPETTCPEPCSTTGTVFDCQVAQLGALVQTRRDADSSLVVLAADLGVTHENQALDRTFWNKGWRDAYLDAGNQECDPKFNVGCTSGRPSTGEDLLLALANYNAVENARTDYVLVSPSLACSPRFDTRRRQLTPTGSAPACSPTGASTTTPGSTAHRLAQRPRRRQHRRLLHLVAASLAGSAMAASLAAGVRHARTVSGARSRRDLPERCRERVAVDQDEVAGRPGEGHEERAQAGAVGDLAVAVG